jgi:phage-related protein
MLVKFAESINGRAYVFDDIIKIKSADDKQMIEGKIDLLHKSQLSRLVDTGDVTKLRKSPLYELKIRGHNVIYRILFTVNNSICILLHFFVKKSHEGIKTPPHEIEKAMGRLKSLNLN